MDDYVNWYMSLAPTLQVFWGCALISTFVFVIQAVLTIIGMDSAEINMDVDFDGDTMDAGGGMSLFTIRSLVNFFVGFGWAGISFYNSISNVFLLYVVSLIVGCAFGYMYIFLRKRLMRLESNGAMDINESLGKEADVYLRIPAEGKGSGKVQISLGGSVFELPAVTNQEDIPSGKRVKVVEVIDGKTLRVELLS